MPDPPAALRDRLRDFEPFAQGQTGTCYLATQVPSGYRGLLKVIPLARFEASERVRLKRELRKQTRFNHEGLPRMIDGGELGDSLWLFREHIPGESLAQRIRRMGKLDPPEALAIAAQVASALDELQRNGLLHRDVKPGHIVLTAGAGDGPPTAKLIDAGVAARLPTGSVFDLIGTPAYISPEQVAGKLVSFRSDLYALGCVLFEMLAGAPPFPDEDVAVVLEAHKNVAAPALELELPSQARTLLSALLAKEPRQRPFSAQQVRRTLEPLLPAGTRLPALGTRAPAVTNPPSRPVAPPAAGGRASHADLPTEELVLEDVVEAIERAPNTLLLGDEELDALTVEEDAEPAAPASASKASEPKAPQPVASVAAAVAQSPEGDPSSVSVQVVHAPEAEPSPSPAGAAAPVRRAVAFDVETLFDDDVPQDAAVQKALQDAAPTQLFRPKDDSGAQTRIGAQAPEVQRSAPPPATKSDSSSLRPPMNRMRSLPLWIGVGGLVVLALVVLTRSGRKHEPQAEPSKPAEPMAKAAPSVSAEPAPAPAPAAPAAQPAAEPKTELAPAEVAKAAPAAPPDKQAAAPSAAAPASAAPAPAAPDEKPRAGETKPVPSAPKAASTQVAAKAASETKPAPAETKPAATAASAKTPASGARTLPATTAAGEGVKRAELQAANAAGRAQVGSGDAKLGAAQGPRDERVAKAEQFKTQARDAYKAGKFVDAAAAYEKATELNPGDAGAFAGLAASRLAAGNADAAVAAYSRAIRLQPNSAGFHAALGRAYLQRGDRDRARAAYQRALELDPNNGAAKTALAQLK